MIYLTNLDGNVKLGFDFSKNLPDDFHTSKSKFEKWVPFVLNLSTSERTIAITDDMLACMTIYEVEKFYNGLRNLVESTRDKRIACLHTIAVKVFLRFRSSIFMWMNVSM